MDLSLVREQHSNLTVIINKLDSLLGIDKSPDISEIEKILANLEEELTAHLLTEDKLLYPFLIKNKDQKIAEISQSFFSSMGGLKKSFSAYRHDWSAEKIQSFPTEFIQATIEISVAFQERIKKEEKILFPLAGSIVVPRASSQG